MKIKNIPLNQIDEIEAFERHQKIVERERMRREFLVENMRDIVSIFKTQQYKAILGDESAPWSGYLAEVEVYYPRNKVEKWRRIIEMFDSIGASLELSMGIPESRLDDLTQISISNKDSFIDWLSQAKTALPLDWKNFIAESKGKPTSENCQHSFKKLEVCSICGVKHQIPEQHEG